MTMPNICRHLMALALLLASLASPLRLQAQAQPRAPESAVSTGTIDGTIVDRQTRRPVESAAVVIEGTEMTAVSAAADRFQIAQVPTGTHVLRAKLPATPCCRKPTSP
jgi:hypothetical protein